MKREYIVVGALVLFLVCGISLASKNRMKMPRSSEEGEPPDDAALEKETYMRQLQHEIEMRQQNPFLCLPKYLCIVQSESGQKKTAVLSSLRPIPHAILKQQQNSGPFPFPVQRPSFTPTSDESREKDNGSDSVEDEETVDYSGSNEEFGLNREDVIHALAVDRLTKNESETKGVMGKLKTLLMPSFKMPNLIPISMPGLPSFFKGSGDKNTKNEESQTPTNSPQNTGNLLKPGQFLKRRTSFFRRTKRQAEESEENLESQENFRNDTRHRTPEQCQLLFSGCELSYDEIMKISNSGAVVVENDGPQPPPLPGSSGDPGYATPPPKRRRPIKIEDDELDHFLREEAHKRLAAIRRTTKRPNSLKYYSNYHPNRPHISIPNTLLVHELHPGQAAQLLYPKGVSGKRPSKIKLQQLQHAQEFLTQDSKYGSTTSFYNKNKPLKHVKPFQYDEDDVETRNPAVGLPILPVRLQWGRPVKIGDKYIRPFQKQHFQQAAPAPFYTSTTQPPPIFSKTPVDMKIPSNIPIFANRTHQAILKAKPYHPHHIPRTKQFDKFGRPVSYASVFTEVAGSSGGVHDYFDKIASTIGQNIIKTEQDLLNSNKKRVSRRKKNRVTSQSSTAKPLDSDEDKDDTTKEEDDPEDTTKEDDKDTEKNKDVDEDVEEEEEEDADEEDEAEDTEIQDDHKKKKNKYDEEKEILAILPSFMQEAIHNDRIRRKNKRKKKKKKKNTKDEIARTDRRRGEPMEQIEYMPISLNRPMKAPSRTGLFRSIYNMMRPKRTNSWSSH